MENEPCAKQNRAQKYWCCVGLTLLSQSQICSSPLAQAFVIAYMTPADDTAYMYAFSLVSEEKKCYAHINNHAKTSDFKLWPISAWNHMQNKRQICCVHPSGIIAQTMRVIDELE